MVRSMVIGESSQRDFGVMGFGGWPMREELDYEGQVELAHPGRFFLLRRFGRHLDRLRLGSNLLRRGVSEIFYLQMGAV